MSLSSIGKAKATTTIEICAPGTRKVLTNADGTPMTITLHGPYSERYEAIIYEQQMSRAAEIAEGKAPDPAEARASLRELTERCVETWDLTLEGDERYPFSPDAVATLFADYPWVRDQVSAALGNVSRFLEPRRPN